LFIRHPQGEEIMTPTQLQKYMLETYSWLRIGLGALAFAFPPLLVAIGWWNGIAVQNSLSAYYFAFAPTDSVLRVFPGRVVFVGILWALGFFLLLYRGFSRTESWALNIAGVSALVVALFPMHTPDYCQNCGSNTYAYIHGIAATTLFVVIAFDAWACTDQTLGELPPPTREWFRWCYSVLASIMVITPILVLAMNFVFGVYNKWILVIEWVGIATFAIYWFLKSYELYLSGAEKLALAGKLEPPPATTRGVSSLRRRAGTLLD
jgi:hypothetical protein